MSDRSELIQVRVTPDKKEEFEEFVEKSLDFNTLSNFLRISAKKQIQETNDGDIADKKEIVDAIDDSLAGIKGELERLNDRIADVESAVHDADDEIDTLAREIYRELPEFRSEEGFDRDRPSHERVVEEGKTLSTPTAWADWFGVEVPTARRACGRMLEYYPEVEFTYEAVDEETSSVPERRYYKVEGV
ncbi:hypothetical protein [Halorientalis regularis]|uniref:hypothetical protein n=1 Tax=Halorientalis regularis TaxID=660518 RepID=UPI0011135F99|nr:hypothetical protein [Halorientalis regularis]